MHPLWSEHHLLNAVIQRADCAPHLAYVSRRWREAMRAARLGIKNSTAQHRFLGTVAVSGHTRLLQWYFTHGYRYYSSWLLPSIRGGHSETIEWVLSVVGRPHVETTQRAALTAANYGNRDMLLRLELLPGAKDSSACAVLTKTGHVSLARELAKRGWAINRHTIARAAGIGDLDFVQWLLEHGVQPDAHMATSAAKNGHVKVLRWCLSCDIPLVVEAAYGAAFRGHVDALQLLARSLAMDEHVEAEAARGGHIKAIEWLDARVQHREWLALPAAIRARQRDAIDWLLAHGHPRSKDIMIEAFHFGYDGDFVRWMLSRGFEPCRAGDWACLKLDVVKDLHALGFSLCPEMYTSLTPCAYKFGSAYLKACQWLLDRDIALPEDLLLRAASIRSATGVEWVTRHGVARTTSHVIARVVDGEYDEAWWMLRCGGWPSDPDSVAAYRAAYERHKDDYPLPDGEYNHVTESWSHDVAREMDCVLDYHERYKTPA